MKINNIDYEIGIYDLEGNFIDSTDSWEVLEKEFKITKKNIITHLCQNHCRIKIYQLVFKNLNNVSSNIPIKIGDITKDPGHKKCMPVAKYYNDKLITVYKSITDAEKLTGIGSDLICQSCIKKCKAGIFYFKYI